MARKRANPTVSGITVNGLTKIDSLYFILRLIEFYLYYIYLYLYLLKLFNTMAQRLNLEQFNPQELYQLKQGF